MQNKRARCPHLSGPLPTSRGQHPNYATQNPHHTPLENGATGAVGSTHPRTTPGAFGLPLGPQAREKSGIWRVERKHAPHAPSRPKQPPLAHPSDLVGPLGVWGPARGSSGTRAGRTAHLHYRTGWVPTTAPEGKTADSGPRERPPGHRSGPMGTARTQGTHGVGRQRPGPFGSGQAPPRADHRPPRRLRWPISVISPTGFLAPTPASAPFRRQPELGLLGRS